ncbi:MAG: hypothetical protein K2X47_19900 [Bdellovibrionales bacterium]|nr:hypothetical protein [Bdellovibrionales bacterium]
MERTCPMQMLAIVSGALMFSVVQVAVIGFLFFGPLPGATAPTFAELTQSPNILGLLAASAFSFVLSFVVPKLILKSTLADLPQKTSFSLEKELLPKFFPSHLVRFALLESVAILGLVLTLLTHNTMLVVGYAVISLLMMALFFPTKEKVTSQIQGASVHKIRLG